MPLYEILAGVHRSVAAREAALTEIHAQVDPGGGNLGPVQLVPLDELYSPKRQIGRWDRGRDFLALVAMMADPVQRGTLPPVVLTPLSPRRAKYFTPLAGVVVNPV